MSLEDTIWRVIDLGLVDGAYHSAAEHTLYESVKAKNSSPTLLFCDLKPTVSLGRSQNYHLDVDHDACRRREVEVIRRKSGGQAVYIDEGYFVVSAIASPPFLTDNVTRLRESFCLLLIDTLHSLSIPAEFRRPDNIVIPAPPTLRTLGNAGQVVTPNQGILAQGSIRHHFLDFEALLDTLQVNGQKLQPYQDQIRNVLTDVVSYKPQITKKQLQDAFLGTFCRNMNTSYCHAAFTSQEKQELQQQLERVNDISWLQGEPRYPSRGVCYFFVGDDNLVPSLRPDTIHES